MVLPLQLIVFSIPSLIYVTAHRRLGEKWNEVFWKIGWKGSRPIHFLWSLGTMIFEGDWDGWPSRKFFRKYCRTDLDEFEATRQIKALNLARKVIMFAIYGDTFNQ